MSYVSTHYAVSRWPFLFSGHNIRLQCRPRIRLRNVKCWMCRRIPTTKSFILFILVFCLQLISLNADFGDSHHWNDVSSPIDQIFSNKSSNVRLLHRRAIDWPPLPPDRADLLHADPSALLDLHRQAPALTPSWNTLSQSSASTECRFTLNAGSGVIYSPNYPAYYATGTKMYCEWHITPEANKTAIEINFQLLNLASLPDANCSDHLTIHAVTNTTQHIGWAMTALQITGSPKLYPKKLVSSGGALIIRLQTCPLEQLTSFKTNFNKPSFSARETLSFASESRISSTLFAHHFGFLATFRAVQCAGCGVGDSQCGEMHHCAGDCGRILSINYPLHYNNNHRCRWLITAPAQHYINVTVDEFDVPSELTASKQKHSDCMFDHVSFIDPSTNKLIGRYCNSNLPPKFILSAWNQLLIEFNSDSNVTGRGFSFRYRVQKFQLPDQLNRELTIPSKHGCCPPGWSYYRSNCYQAFLGDQILQWYDAEAQCAQYGLGRNGHLVSILDSNEMSAVFHFLLNVWKSPTYKAFYIGLVDNFKEGSYRWSDQSPMAYTDWAPAQLELDESEVNAPQPDGGAFEDCTIIKFDFGHSTANWHDIPCSLGSHRHVVRGAPQLNNSDLIDSYICKMQARCEQLSGTNKNNSKNSTSVITSFVPMYRQPRVLDEENVRRLALPHRYFICDNLEVISFLRRCDGTPQCSDHSDELNCPVPPQVFFQNNHTLYQDRDRESRGLEEFGGCLPEQFRCENGRCISISNFCDFVNDCLDNSDEINCENIQAIVSGSSEDKRVSVISGCQPNEFRCNNGECISAEKRCDLLIDCKDESDEGNVCSAGNHCNRNFTFQCYYGNCIPLYAVCDRHRDCPGKFHEDEHKGICQQRMLSTHQLSQINLPTNQSSQYVEEQSTEVILNHLMFDRLGACRQSKKRTCLDLFLYHGANISGTYEIKPENAILSFQVYCLFPLSKFNNTVDKNHIRTIVGHDSHTRMLVQSRWPKMANLLIVSNAKSSVTKPVFFEYSHTVVYDLGLHPVRTLQSDSKGCWQFVRWHCSIGSPIFNPTTTDNSSRLRSGDGNWYPFPFQCRIDGLLTSNCHCQNSSQVISFRISGKHLLPVLEVQLVAPVDEFTNRELRGLHELSAIQCQGDSDDIQAEFEDDCKDISKIEFFQCQSGQIIKAKYRCIFDHDQYGYQMGCRDVTQLRNCENYQCSDDYVKCPDSYCIPPRYICDGKRDCIHGEDEEQCDQFQCPGRYRCLESNYCIYLHQLCDGIRQCHKGDDEWFCHLPCPDNCECIGLYVRCANANLTGPPEGLSLATRKLDLTDNALGPILETTFFTSFSKLGELILRRNQIQRICPDQFMYLSNLYLLDLRENQLLIFESRAFAGLQNMRWLFLQDNPRLRVIEPKAFIGMRKLRTLNVSNADLRVLREHAFYGLKSLRRLILRSNQLRVIESGAFADLQKLQYLDMRGNTILGFRQDIFDPLRTLHMLNTDSFKFCCLVQQNLPFDQCFPQSDEISDCEDLMSSPLQRSFLWILGFVACTCNFAVVIWRFKTRTFVNAVSSTLVLSLGCADFLMGIYLLIIAIVDQFYRGRYIEVSDIWRRSALCKFCGVLSTLSSEASVFTLVFITLDRLICIVFPFSKWKFSISFTYKVIIAIWTSAFAFSLLPIFLTSYFKDEFYSRSGVCLALHITNKKPAGWEYAVALFLVTNLIAFLFIVACYTFMYQTIQRSSRRITRMMSKEVRERQVGRQMAFIVMTNFCCWFPIIIMGLLALFGHPIPASVYSWTAVFILPVNSAVNPIIYTLAHFRPQLFKNRRRDSLIGKTFYPLKHTGSMQASKTQGLMNKSPKPPPGYLNLLDFLKENRELKMSDLLHICYSLSEQIKQVHSAGYAIGRIAFDTVFVTNKLPSNELHVYLPDYYSYRVVNGPHCDDYATDMEDYGLMIKKMLQIYHSKLKFSHSFDYRLSRKLSKNERKSENSVPSHRSISSASSTSHNLNLLFAPVNGQNSSSRQKRSISPAENPSNHSASSQHGNGSSNVPNSSPNVIKANGSSKVVSYYVSNSVEVFGSVAQTK